MTRTWNFENQIHLTSKWKLIVFAENYKLEQSYEDHLVVKLVLVSKSIYSLNFFICMTLTNCYKAAFLPPSRDLLYILKQSSKCWVKFISRRNEWHPHKLFTLPICAFPSRTHTYLAYKFQQKLFRAWRWKSLDNSDFDTLHSTLKQSFKTTNNQTFE